MANHMKAVFYGVRDYPAFIDASQTMVDHIKLNDGIFIGDNLIAFLPTLTSNGPQQARLWRILAEDGELSGASRDARLHVISEASVLAHAEYARAVRAPGADLDAFDEAAVARLDARFKTFDADKAQPVAAWLDGQPPIPSEISGTSLVFLLKCF